MNQMNDFRSRGSSVDRNVDGRCNYLQLVDSEGGKRLDLQQGEDENSDIYDRSLTKQF